MYSRDELHEMRGQGVESSGEESVFWYYDAGDHHKAAQMTHELRAQKFAASLQEWRQIGTFGIPIGPSLVKIHTNAPRDYVEQLASKF